MAKAATGGRRGVPWRMIGWSGVGLLLLLPLLAHAPWTASDFVVAALLLGSVGGAFELIVRKSRSLAYRAGAALAVVAAFLTIWVNGAVGMIGSEGNPFNLLFGGVLLVALAGAIVARFEPAGMTRAMVLAAIAQGVVSGIGLSSDARGGVFSMAFAALWLLSAWLFRKTARELTAIG